MHKALFISMMRLFNDVFKNDYFRDMKKLVRLVQTLSQAEIRYFKLNADRNRSPNKSASIYLTLFDELLDARSGSAEAILKQQTNVQKEYLNSRLLDSLVEYSTHTNKEMQSRRKLEQARLLFSRNLDVDCVKLLKRIQKEAEASEDQFLLLEIVDTYRWRRAMGKYDQDFQVLRETEMDALEKIRTQSIQEDLAYEIYNLHLKKSVSDRISEEKTKAIDYYINLEELKVGRVLDTFRANYFYQWSLSLLEYYEFGATPKLVELIRNRLALFEQDPHKKKPFKPLYVIALSHYLSIIQTLGKEKDQEKLLNSLLKDVDFVNNLNAQEFYLLGLSFLKSISFFGGLERKKEYLIFVQNSLKKLNRQLSVGTHILINYELAYVHFIYENESEALKNISSLIAFGSNNQFLERQFMARVIKIIIFLDKGDLDYVDSLIISTRTFAKKSNRLNNFEEMLISYFRALGKTVSKKEQLGVHIIYGEKLKDMSEAIERMRYYFDIARWNQSKVQDIPMHKLIDGAKLETQ